MGDNIPQPALLRSLARLVRGLSALFWGLPIALVVCVQGARMEWFRSLSVLPQLASTALLAFGLWQLAGFQRQERVWRSALDRAALLSLVNVFLSPFIYFWNRVPENRFFFIMVVLLAVSGLLFLASLNVVLRRLGAMLPDEALRLEIRQFTTLNLYLVSATFALSAIYLALVTLPVVPPWLRDLLVVLDRGGVSLRYFIFFFLLPLAILVLLPLAMTMALLWKTKEVVMDGIFGMER